MVSRRAPSNLARQEWRHRVQTHPRRLAKWSQLQQQMPQVPPCLDRKALLAPLQVNSHSLCLAKIKVPLANSRKTSKAVVPACSGEVPRASSVALGPSHHRMEPVRMCLAAHHLLARPDRLPACLETRGRQALVRLHLEVRLARVPSLEAATSPWAVAVSPRRALEEPSSSSSSRLHQPSQPLEVPQHLAAVPHLAGPRSLVGRPPLAAAQRLAAQPPLAPRLRHSRLPQCSSSSSSHLDSWRLGTWKAPPLEDWLPSSSRVPSSRAWASAHFPPHRPLEVPRLASGIVPISKILHQPFHSGGTDGAVGEVLCQLGAFLPCDLS